MISDLTNQNHPSSLPSKIQNPQSTITAQRSAQRFSFRSYQRDDIARASLHDGAIIAWDPGLGKTMAMFAWPWLKRSRHCLIVAPATLHDQIIAEGNEKFHTRVIQIRDQDHALELIRSGVLPRISPAHDQE